MKKKLQILLSVGLLSTLVLTGCGLQNAKVQHPSDYGNFTLEQVASIANDHAAQGTAVYADNLFICDKYGYCHMYTLPEGEFIAKFALGSMNSAEGPSQNHSNQMMFGSEKFDDDDPYPLLYVTTGYSNDHDESGAYYAKCSVERIRHSEERGWYAEIVQTIEFNDAANIPDSDINGTLTNMYKNGKFLYTSGNGYDEASGYQKIGYGWPHFYVDTAPTDETEDKLYIYSTRFRGSEHWENEAQNDYSITDFGQDNSYIFTSFELPDLPDDESDADYGKTVTLYPKDIIGQFETEFDTYAFQGGTMYGGRIFHAYGDGKQTEKHRNAILIFDIAQQKKVGKLELHSTKMASWEPECCFFYNGELSLSAYNMNDSNQIVNIYSFEFENTAQ